jgi:hypothetical protein
MVSTMVGTEVGELGECPTDEWAAQQTILLRLNTARDLNSSPFWTDANELEARLVIVVTGWT